MLRRHGFAILIFLLRQLPPMLWTVEAVTACVSITSCFASAEALHHEAVWLLFGVPRLWVFTKLPVQVRQALPSTIDALCPERTSVKDARAAPRASPPPPVGTPTLRPSSLRPTRAPSIAPAASPCARAAPTSRPSRALRLGSWACTTCCTW